MVSISHDEYYRRVQSLRAPLTAVALRLTACPDAAEDVVGESIVAGQNALKSYDDARGPAGFAAWMRRIVLNAARDWARRRGRSISLEELAPDARAELEARWAVIDCDAKRDEVNDAELLAEARMRFAHADLTKIERGCIVYRLSGCTVTEIARAYGVSHSTICRKLASARRKLLDVPLDVFAFAEIDHYERVAFAGSPPAIYHAPTKTGAALARIGDVLSPARLRNLEAT